MIGLCMWSVMFANGQTLSYEYDYDNAGNRTRSTIVQLNRDGCENHHEQYLNPLTDVIDNGLTMTLFPNPAKESIRFETSGENKIGAFILSDAAGRIIKKGSCEDQSLTLDLSGQHEGIYLLEVIVKEKPYIYKIIKQ